MRSILTGLLVAAFVALPSSAQTYGLGMGAASGDSVVLKIDGRNTTLHLGTGASTSAAESFLTCLVTDRVIRVERTGSAAKLLMLDKSNVADHLREFLQEKTSTDPCALGKAAYTPVLARLEPDDAGATTARAPMPATQPAPAEAKKKLGRRTQAAAPMANGDAVKVLGEAAPRVVPNSATQSGGTAYRAATAPAASAPQNPYQQPAQSTVPTMPVGAPTMGPTPTTMPATPPTTSTYPPQ
jgi:hypothetical protein